MASVRICVLILFVAYTIPALYAQEHQSNRTYSKSERDSLKVAVEAHPDSLSYHDLYMNSVWPDTEALQRQYKKWMSKYPQMAEIPFALGRMFYRGEYPEAKSLLLKSLELNPHTAEAWYMLSMDAERWGDAKAGMLYMKRAWEEAPENAAYGFYYSMDIGRIHPDSLETKVYELAKKFPKDERAAQGLYVLATEVADYNVKVRVLEDLRTLYPPDQFRWSMSGFLKLYDVYLLNQPEKALAISSALPSQYKGARDTLARDVLLIHYLIERKRFQEAISVSEKLKVPYRSTVDELLLLLKTEVIFSGGDKDSAYNSLLAAYAMNPTDAVAARLQLYGKQMGKNITAITEDVWRRREVATRSAAPFSLGQYTSGKKISLEDCKGKVVLLTFWFPGCGPCRAEFPHFQEVINRYSRDKVEYLGINVFPEQDAYVLPFMKTTGYSFIPLRGTAKWAKDAYSVRVEPSNFLIDKQGRIVFSNFRINETNENTLQLMINSLLDPGKTFPD